jgi:hypothetical protein
MNIRGLNYSVPMLSGWRFLVVVVSFLVVGCTKANPSATCNDGTCTDPDFPYCDVDGSVGGVPGDCVAVSCTPGEIKECRADMAFTCNPMGSGYALESCDLGCADTPTPHCKYLQPKYLPDACETSPSTVDMVVSSSGMLDPNLDSNCTGGVVTQNGASDLCVIRYKSFTLTADATLDLVGLTATTGRAVAFVTDDDLTIAGVLDAGGHVGVNGPGGGTFNSGTAPSKSTLYFGGGGAGGATNGGDGATGTITSGGTDGGATNHGQPTMNPSLASALFGGASSPLIAADSSPMLFGGGGGAVTLISCDKSVNITGSVNAGGGGGPGGFFLLDVFPGFGGGAGGNVVLQGRNVSVTGQMFANGGGGGGGASSVGVTSGNAGADGSMSDTTPAAGAHQIHAGGTGGAGGIVGVVPGIGTHPTENQSSPGAGGGSVGFLQIYTPMGTTPTVMPSHVSPAFQPNGIVETR